MENIKLTIPDSWSEISIGTYQEIINITTKSDIVRLKEVIYILTDMDIDKIPVSEVSVITSHLNWMQTLPDEKQLKKVISIDGVEYGLIEKFESITLGEWIDLEEYGKDRSNNLHKIFAILYRPIVNGTIEPYNADTLNDRAAIFEDKLMLGDAYAAMVFFSLIGINFTKIFQTSLEQMS